MQFELYKYNFGYGTAFPSYAEYDKEKILDDMVVANACSYYVINKNNAGCLVSPYKESDEKTKYPMYSMAGFLFGELKTLSFTALVAVGNRTYYLRVNDGIISQSSDVLLDVNGLMELIGNLGDHGEEIFIDSKLSDYFDSENGSADDFNEMFTDFEKLIKFNKAIRLYKYSRLNGAGVAKGAFQIVFILSGVFLVLWMFGLIGSSKKEEVLIQQVIGKSAEEKMKEKRELMKKVVYNSLKVDTTKPYPVDFYHSCKSKNILDVLTIGGWKKTSSICKEGSYLMTFLRSKGHATSTNFEEIALGVFPKRNILINSGTASISTYNDVERHKFIERKFLPESGILDIGRSFYETRKDILLKVKFNDFGRKNLTIVYDDVIYPVDDDLNYSYTEIQLNLVPLYVLGRLTELYNTKYSVLEPMIFSGQLVSTKLTIYYR